MKIKLSKSQWEIAGRKAGWMKKAQSGEYDVKQMQGLLQGLKNLKKEYFGDSSMVALDLDNSGDPQSEIEYLINTLERYISREEAANFREMHSEGDPTAIAMGEQ
jgi:hypothetical protein